MILNQRLRKKRKENIDKEYDSDAETVDPREENELSREQEEEVIITKEKKSKKQEKKEPVKDPEPTPKVKEKTVKKIPYPNRQSIDPNKDLYDSFSKALANLRLELPLADAIQVPTYKKFIRDILNKKKKITETVAVLTSYPPQERLPAKLGDPGIPTISCAIGTTNISNALCDLGAGVSVMPLSLYKKLDLGELAPTSITLQMADKTTKQPAGIIENVLLRIDQHVVPTDFIVLDMPEDEKLSIILGRPFLSTAGASVDCALGKIVFNIYDDEIVRYFPKKREDGEKYVPPAKRIQVVNALDDGQPKVRIRN